MAMPSALSAGSGAPPMASVAEDWETAAEQSSAVHNRLKSVLAGQRSRDAACLAQATIELEEVEKELGTVAASASGEENEETGIAAVLMQLEVEPSDDKELAAKFSLYENFLESVVLIREETMRFWDENQDVFEGHAKDASRRAIKQIDAADCMGIPEDNHPYRVAKWFVHSMCEKAHENSQKIGSVLSILRTRLELLQKDEDGDCPFCLEALAEKEVITLGCCHRSCQDCWDFWVQIKGPGEAFCPLCRHVQFLEEIVSQGEDNDT